MNLRVLGCSGAEFPKHRNPGFLLDKEILFDAGSLTNVLDAKEQLRIKHIFITHAHLDHIRGIPFLADNIIIGHWKQTVNILSIPSVLKTVKWSLLNKFLWPDMTVIPSPQNPVLNLVPLELNRPFTVNDYSITPYRVKHSVPAAGYLVEDSKNRSFFYTGDTGPSDMLWKKIGDKKIYCLIIECSFPNRMGELAVKTGHLTPRLLQDGLSKMKHIPQKIFIVHVKPQHFKVIKRELQGLKIKNLTVLRDGESIRI
jgi:ribonuclease BN (tRNA processing enzyme)